MPTHKKGQDRDKYYQLAKDQGYRSRAAFKLIQINKRYDFLSKAKVAIDLCAAPGGWCQVAAKFMPAGSIVLGVDLLPIKPIRGVKTIVGDITTASTRKEIMNELQGWKADVVLCDGAPNIGAAYNKDAFVQNELVLAALKTATEHLNKGGAFCTKVYRSVDYNAIVWALQQLFSDVQTMKPNSSRSQSSEIFLVCLNYAAPRSIDSKLFDPNHVFKEVADPSLKKPDVLHKKYDTSHKRHRTGYEESAGITLHPTATVRDFVLSREPVRLLSDVTELVFSENCQQYREHEKTKEEIVLAARDLQVLGKIDFKKLLRWRQHMREAFHASSAESQGEREQKEAEEEVEVDEETRIRQEITALRETQKSQARREEKKTRREMRKEREKQRLGMLNSAFEQSGDAELFSLDFSTTKREMELLGDIDLGDEEVGGLIAREINGEEREKGDTQEAKKFIQILDNDLEDELEEDYKRFLSHREMKKLYTGEGELGEGEGGERTASKKRRVKEGAPERMLADQQREDEELLEEEWEDVEEEERGKGKRKKRGEALQSEVKRDMEAYLKQLNSMGKKKGDGESEEEDSEGKEMEEGEGESEEEEGQFMKTASKPSKVTLASKWFANPLFSSTAKKVEAQGMEKEMEEEEGEESLLMPKTEKEKRKEKRKKEQARKEKKEMKRQKKSSTSTEEEEGGEGGMIGGPLKASAQEGKQSFEIVPREDSSALLLEDALPRHDERVYDSDNEEYDSHDKLLTLAMGTYMLRNSRKKALIDASYNRYAWNDPTALPAWFLDDEMRHNRPQVPVPNALIEQIKNKYELTGTKVIKKVAEARARKRKRALTKLKAAKKQAALMAENSELSERQKVKAISKAANRYRSEGKASKVYVTTKKTKAGSVGTTAGGKGKGKMKFVDKRMKKEVRATKARTKRGKK